jgi:ribosomal protein S18 acetylase RimI-like enzyme
VYDDGAYVGRAQIGENSICGEPGIWGVNVEPEHRGQGHGRRIMRHLISVARRRRYHAICLKVEHDNDIARRLYRSLGFVEADHTGGVAIDMRLVLT